MDHYCSTLFNRVNNQNKYLNRQLKKIHHFLTREKIDSLYVRAGEYNLGIDDEPLSYVERKVKTLVIHPKYQSSYQDRAVKTMARLDVLMKQFGIEDSNPFLSNNATFRNYAEQIFQDWKIAEYDYDIALLKLDRPIDFQDNVVPICLPQDENDFLGKTAWATGWGNLGKVCNKQFPFIIE